jgi:hypothetical protein
MIFKKGKAWFIFIAILVLFCPYNAFSCGPFFNEIIFTYSIHPDFPFEKFSQGDLGILQPTYKRSFLFVAYRYAAGRGLDKDEQKGMINVWNDYFSSDWYIDVQEIIKPWLKVRNRVVGGSNIPSVYKNAGSRRYYSYLNCSADAFKTAASTLEKRIKQFGIKSPEIKDWILAQDTVFENCNNGKHLPQSVKPGTHPLLKADRAYQIASAHFYAGDFDTAEELFRQIAEDNASPWKELAPYIAARAILREATLSDDLSERTAGLQKAEKELQKILTDKTLNKIHRFAQQLLGMVHFNLYPEKRMYELIDSILKKNSGRTLKQDYWDFTLLFSKYEDLEESKKSDVIKKLAGKNDFMNWIYTIKNNDKASLSHSIKKWKETNSLQWLVTSLMKIKSGHPELTRILKTAENINEDSPVFLTIAYHKARIAIESKKIEEARSFIDNLLFKKAKSLSPSTLNQFYHLRMVTAATLKEFLKYSQRIPAGIIGGESDRGIEFPLNMREDIESAKIFLDGRKLLDADSVRFINIKIPLKLLKEISTDKDLPTHLRKNLVIATWTRAVLLNRHDIASEINSALKESVPDLIPFIEAYAESETINKKKFAAIFTILKFPGMKPFISGGMERSISLHEVDDFRDNWWCAIKLNPQTGDFQNYQRIISNPFIDKDNEENYPHFLNEEEKVDAAKEWQTMTLFGSAPNYFAKQVIQYAKNNPDDIRVPEVLHYVVRSTRVGCTDVETTKLSKEAFQLLHGKYYSSPWAKKTKYWY